MKKNIRVFLSLLLFCLLFFSCVRFGLAFLAEFYSAKSEELLIDGDLVLSLNYANKAIELNSREEAYYRRRAKVFIAQSSKEEALQDISAAINLNPNNLATLRNVVPQMYFLSLKDPYMEVIDETYLPKASEFYKYMYSTYPNDAGILVSLAYYQKKLGLTDDYLKTLDRISLLRSDLLEWHPLLLE